MPPHCLKKNAVPDSRHDASISSTHPFEHRTRPGSALAADDRPCSMRRGRDIESRKRDLFYIKKSISDCHSPGSRHARCESTRPKEWLCYLDLQYAFKY